MSLETLIATARHQGASDLHLEAGLPAALRIRGSLRTRRSRGRSHRNRTQRRRLGKKFEKGRVTDVYLRIGYGTSRAR